MINLKAPFGIASLALLISAGIHIGVLATSPGAYAASMPPAAAFWVALAFGLRQGSRWLAALAFLAAAFGGSVALGFGLTGFGLVSMLFFGIAATDWCAAIWLFGALWRTPGTDESRA